MTTTEIAAILLAILLSAGLAYRVGYREGRRHGHREGHFCEWIMAANGSEITDEEIERKFDE